METLSPSQFGQRYGTIAQSEFNPNKKEKDLFAEIKSAFAQGVSKIQQGIQEGNPTGNGGIGGLVTGVGKIGGGAAEVVASPLAPALNRTIGAAINFVGDKLSTIPAVQKFAQTSVGKKTAKVAETVADYANAAGLVAGTKGTSSAVKGAPAAIRGAMEAAPELPNIAGSAQYAKGAVMDIIPTKQSLIDHNLARALDLTPGDLSNIAKSTGNEIGPWMSQNNLIGTNKANTLGLIKNFFTENYDAVRSEIKKVDTSYKPDQVPRVTDVLRQIAAETQGQLGLEAVGKEVASLLKKEVLTLEDIQRVKELLDDHFNLYKVTGDVQAGLAKQGLANVRQEIKNFIESEVQKSTGADIRAMNNNVATARSLGDAIETRTPRGLTRAQLTWRDAAIGMGLTYFGSPLAGLAAVAVWKVLTSPTARLRLSRYLDGLNDAQRADVSAAIRDNKLTPEIKKVLDLRNDDQLPEQI